MKIRKRCLPEGWYPSNPQELKDLVAGWESEIPGERPKGKAHAVVVPHAGWYFSGKLAWRTLRQLNREADCVVVVGGHLPAGRNPLLHLEDGEETPLGILETETSLRDFLKEILPVRADAQSDNTVEVQLPLVKYLFPEAKMVGLRVSSGNDADSLAKAIGEWAERAEKSVVVVGSTDLTHYGPAYGFLEGGRGGQGLSWAQQNDADYIEALLQLDPGQVRDLVQQNHCACSSGAAETAVVFARQQGVEAGKLVAYESSYNLRPDASFVGYAGIVFSSPC